jgi:hypothetical protein
MESEQHNTGGVIMKRVSLAALALIGAAGCQDAVTSPQLGTDSNLRYAVSNPPPPPIDGRANGSFCCVSTSVTPLSSIQQSSGFRFSVEGSSLRGPAFTVQPTCTSFSLPFTYLFNKQTQSGYVHFSNDPDNAVASSANGMVRFAHGDFSGAGTLEIETDCGLIVIDLSSVLDNSSFFGQPFGFQLSFESALFYFGCPDKSCTPISGSADIFAGGGD